MPACVWAVLTFYERAFSYERVLEACRLGPLGAVDELALDGLTAQGLEIDLFYEFDLQVIGELLAEERPPIVTYAAGAIGDQPTAHAVVICGVTEDEVVVMDPAIGDYRAIPHDEARLMFGSWLRSGFVIAGLIGTR